jgi:hypothetical protein
VGGGIGEETLTNKWNGASWAWTYSIDPGNSQNAIGGVSCVSSGVCRAAGNYLNKTGNRTGLIEEWTGTEWKAQSATTPPETLAWRFNGISCTSTSACTAVGNRQNSGSLTTELLAERWNGSTWSVQSPIAISESAATFDGVSCGSSTFCVAVGDSWKSTSHKALAEEWNGTEWKVMTLPPGGNEMEGVSCTSSTWCVAVGEGESKARVVRWNGSEWAQMSLTPPAESTSPKLYGVTCISSTSCMAVGRYTISKEQFPWAATWNGTEWTQMSVPRPAEATKAQFRSISCTAAKECTAVGTYGKTTESELPFAARYQ